VKGRFKEEKYRWVILAIGSCAMILNGLLNNIVIPIANKLAEVYNQSVKIINLPIVLSFLVFSLANIPINHFIDRKGFKMGYIIGISLYLTGMFLVSLINISFPLVIIGYLVFTFGQPFILNAPATIATYWFLP
jgi:MFS family permease